MDDFDTMRDEDSPRKRGGLAFWVALWAMLVALGSAYFTYQSAGVVGEADRRLAFTVGGFEDNQARLVELERLVREKLQVIERQVSEMQANVRRNSDQSRNLGVELAELRRALRQLAGEVAEHGELMAGLTAPAEAAPVAAATPVPTAPVVTPAATPAPRPTETAAADRPAAPERYRIAEGDTLSGIARRHGVSLDRIIQLNPGINPNLIRVGDEIRLR